MILEVKYPAAGYGLIWLRSRSAGDLTPVAAARWTDKVHPPGLLPAGIEKGRRKQELSSCFLRPCFIPGFPGILSGLSGSVRIFPVFSGSSRIAPVFPGSSRFCPGLFRFCPGLSGHFGFFPDLSCSVRVFLFSRLCPVISDFPGFSFFRFLFRCLHFCDVGIRSLIPV